jgi:hypothetical protein
MTRAVGMSAVLVKPVTLSALDDCLRQTGAAPLREDKQPEAHAIDREPLLASRSSNIFSALASPPQAAKPVSENSAASPKPPKAAATATSAAAAAAKSKRVRRRQSAKKENRAEQQAPLAPSAGSSASIRSDQVRKAARPSVATSAGQPQQRSANPLSRRPSAVTAAR